MLHVQLRQGTEVPWCNGQHCFYHTGTVAVNNTTDRLDVCLCILGMSKISSFHGNVLDVYGSWLCVDLNLVHSRVFWWELLHVEGQLKHFIWSLQFALAFGLCSHNFDKTQKVADSKHMCLDLSACWFTMLTKNSRSMSAILQLAFKLQLRFLYFSLWPSGLEHSSLIC